MNGPNDEYCIPCGLFYDRRKPHVCLNLLGNSVVDDHTVDHEVNKFIKDSGMEFQDALIKDINLVIKDINLVEKPVTRNFLGFARN